MQSCITPQSKDGRRVFRNGCKTPINFQLFDFDKRAALEHELKPVQDIRAFNGFGAVCPGGHRSDINLTVEDALVFERDAYYCIKK